MKQFSNDTGSQGAPARWFAPLSLGLGAALMYYCDPDRGRRRRALVRDQFIHAGRKLRNARGVVVRDIAGRSAGLWAGATRWLRPRVPVSDELLRERVRAQLGRYVSHPHAVAVHVEDGCATLSGPILAAEVAPLLRAVKRVPGVTAVASRLEVHEKAGKISALQGGVPRSGNRSELLQDNWSPTARFITGSVGAMLVACSTRSNAPGALLMGVAGGALLLRAASNRNLGSLVGVGDRRRPIEVEKSIRIAAPVQQVYEFWTNVENFPRFMSRVRKVRRLDEDRSHWVVSGPAGVPVEWTARVTRRVPEQCIEWCADDGSTVQQTGVARFEPDGEDACRIHIRLRYVPPAGAVGHAVASLFGADPKRDMDADLLRLKSMIETGRIPHDAARRAEWPHAVQTSQDPEQGIATPS